MKILIIKLGSIGEVLRTTPLLTALKKKYPESEIHWLTDENAVSVLDDNLLIDNLMAIPSAFGGDLQHTSYDLALNLDKEEDALSAMTLTRAKSKMGFGYDKNNRLAPLDDFSFYAYRLGVDDDLKCKVNKKTYQQVSFEQAGLSFLGEDYVFTVPAQMSAYMRYYLKTLGAYVPAPRQAPVIGLDAGSSRQFAGGQLPIETILRLSQMFHETYGATIYLLGGAEDAERVKEIERRSKTPLWNTGAHAIPIFAGIVGECDLVLCGDTIAMHVAIATKTPLLVYFGATRSSEIELYGLGEKMSPSIACAPCYKHQCPTGEICMAELSPEVLFDKAKILLTLKGFKTTKAI